MPGRCGEAGINRGCVRRLSGSGGCGTGRLRERLGWNECDDTCDQESLQTTWHETPSRPGRRTGNVDLDTPLASRALPRARVGYAGPRTYLIFVAVRTQAGAEDPPLERDPGREVIVRAEHGLLLKLCRVQLSNLLDILAGLSSEPGREKEDEDERLLLDDDPVVTSELAIRLDQRQAVRKPRRDFLIEKALELLFGHSGAVGLCRSEIQLRSRELKVAPAKFLRHRAPNDVLLLDCCRGARVD